MFEKMDPKKCNHLKDTLDLYRKKENLYRYSCIQILYETEKGRWVKCNLCGKTWYTQAKYSEDLPMQR